MEVDRSKLKEVETDQESEGSSEEMIESPRSVAKVRRLNNRSNFEYAQRPVINLIAEDSHLGEEYFIGNKCCMASPIFPPSPSTIRAERTIVLERERKKEQKEEAEKHLCLQKQRGNVKSIVSKNPRLLTALLEQIFGSDELKREYGELEELKRVDRSKLKEVETDQESEGSSEEMMVSPRSVAKVRRLNNRSNSGYVQRPVINLIAEDSHLGEDYFIGNKCCMASPIFPPSPSTIRAERTIVLERKRKKEQKEEAEKHLCLQKQRGNVKSIVSKNPRLLTALLEQISGSDELKREYRELEEQKARGEEKSTPLYETERTIVLERKRKKEQKEEAGKHICLQKQRGNVKSIVSKNPRLLTALLEQISGSDELKREYGELEEQKSRAEEKSTPLYQKERTIVLERKRKKQLGCSSVRPSPTSSSFPSPIPSSLPAHHIFLPQIGVVQSQNACGNRSPMAHCTRFAIPL